MSRDTWLWRNTFLYSSICWSTYWPNLVLFIIHYSLFSNSIELTYFKPHNYPITVENIVCQPIPKYIKPTISWKFSLDVPVKEIWKDVLENFSGPYKREDQQYQLITRAHLLKKSIIFYMKRKVNYKRRLHPDDNTSIFLMV